MSTDIFEVPLKVTFFSEHNIMICVLKRLYIIQDTKVGTDVQLTILNVRMLSIYKGFFMSTAILYIEDYFGDIRFL